MKPLVRASSVLDPAQADTLLQLSSPEPPTPVATKPEAANVEAAPKVALADEEDDLNNKIALIECPGCSVFMLPDWVFFQLVSDMIHLHSSGQSLQPNAHGSNR